MITSSWAYDGNASEKAKNNQKAYEGLRHKALRKSNPTKEEMDKYTCYTSIGPGYGHVKYKILSNPHKLTELELALICDEGNLCFGHRTEGDIIVIHTD